MKRSLRSLVVVATMWLGVTFAATASYAKIINDPTPRTCGPIALIGDSLSNGYKEHLVAQMVAHDVGPFRFDICSGRTITRDSNSFPSGATAIRTMKASGFDPKYWVIGLGGNDFHASRRGALDFVTEIEKILTLLGPDKVVSWVNIWHRKSPTTNRAFDAALRVIATRHPHFSIVDWASVLQAHPRWFRPDGVHINFAGTKVRNLMMVDAAVAMCSEAVQ